MKLLLAAVITAAAALLGAHTAKAEDCAMAGCTGRVGYVFLPTGNFETKRPIRFFVGGGISCVPEENANPFGGYRLPVINAVETIRTDTQFFEETDIQENLAEFQPQLGELAKSGRTCTVVWRQPESNGLREGAKVRILGYRTFLGSRTVKGAVRTTTFKQQLLFALVLVTAN